MDIITDFGSVVGGSSPSGCTDGFQEVVNIFSNDFKYLAKTEIINDMESKIKKGDIPYNVQVVSEVLEKKGFSAFVVGGSVRDMLMGRVPTDFDLTTDALPDEIVAILEKKGIKAVYENQFGTVMAVFEGESEESTVRSIEITPFRSETGYTDHRRPDSVKFSKTITEDLQRRDFTVNAIAYQISTGELIDLFDGQKDINEKILRTVGNPTTRFKEDALRLIRAIRFSSQLGFSIEGNTLLALGKLADDISYVSQERITDEFIKLVMTDRVKEGIELLRETGILQIILPEMMEGHEISQDRNHIYDVLTHNLNAGQNSANQGWPLHVRLASLWHDIGKPRTKRYDNKNKVSTFFGHEVVGARMVDKMMKRMKFPKKLTDDVVKLVRYHMFFSDTEQITLSAVRRMIVNVGEDLIWDLMLVRRSDRIGMGRPKAAPFRLRMYESMIEEALRDPISVKMLKLNGDIMIAEMGMKPGKRMGYILHILLDKVLDDPTVNSKETLWDIAKDLDKFSDDELYRKFREAKQKQEMLEEVEINKLRAKHKVHKNKKTD